MDRQTRMFLRRYRITLHIFFSRPSASFTTRAYPERFNDTRTPFKLLVVSAIFSCHDRESLDSMVSNSWRNRIST